MSKKTKQENHHARVRRSSARKKYPKRALHQKKKVALLHVIADAERKADTAKHLWNDPVFMHHLTSAVMIALRYYQSPGAFASPVDVRELLMPGVGLPTLLDPDDKGGA